MANFNECKTCNVKYPDSVALWFDECGICGLKRSNDTHGIIRDKFDGEMAEQARQDAINYRATQ